MRLDMSVASSVILDTVALGDNALREHISCNIRMFIEFGAMSFHPKLIRLYALQQAILFAQAWTRMNIDRTEASGKSDAFSKFDSESSSDSDSLGTSESGGYNESYATSERDWERKSKDDSSSFSKAFDGSSSTSGSTGYDRSTKSSRLITTAFDTMTGREDGLSNSTENIGSDSKTTPRNSVNGGTAGEMYNVQLNVPLGPTLGISNVSWSVGSVKHGYRVKRSTDGKEHATNFQKRFTGAVTDSLSLSVQTANGGASDVRNAARSGSSSMTQNGGLNAGSGSSGSANSKSRSSAIREAHTRFESAMNSASSSTTHAESAGMTASSNVYKHSQVYYSQLFDSLVVMAENVRYDIKELEADLSTVFAGVSVGQMHSQLPVNRNNPKAWQFATAALSPCRTAWPSGCGMTDSVWKHTVALLTV
jgi:hypothetical protein